MKYALVIFALMLSIACIARGTSKGAPKFDMVFFSVMSFLFLAVAIFVGGVI